MPVLDSTVVLVPVRVPYVVQLGHPPRRLEGKIWAEYHPTGSNRAYFVTGKDEPVVLIYTSMPDGDQTQLVGILDRVRVEEIAKLMADAAEPTERDAQLVSEWLERHHLYDASVRAPFFDLPMNPPGRAAIHGLRKLLAQVRAEACQEKERSK